MPVPYGQGLLAVPQSATYQGDTITVPLGVTGVGQGPDNTAILSLSGTFANAVIAVETVSLGQPMVQSPAFGTGPPAPASVSEWGNVEEINLLSGSPVSAPIGPVSSTGVAGTALQYAVPCGTFAQLRLRLISIGSGAIQGGIATVPFPVGQQSLPPGANIEDFRNRVGISILLEGMGINLQDLTAADQSAFS